VAADLAGAHAQLAEADPAAAARIAPEDRQRIARALEVHMATGKPISSFQGAGTPYLGKDEWVGVTLTAPREAVYDRINARTTKMMKAGALEEARRLWARNLDRELPVMRAHGMPGFCEHFDGRTSLADAVERCSRDTRRYAKRQMTWIAHQFTFWPRVPAMGTDVRVRVVAALHQELLEARAG
jgi:tRNA dimethylallyltransferase